jgi:hypothetical protein
MHIDSTAKFVSTSQAAVQRRREGVNKNNSEKKRYGRKRSWPNLSEYTSICQEGMKKSTKI